MGNIIHSAKINFKVLHVGVEKFVIVLVHNAIILKLIETKKKYIYTYQC